MKSLGMPVWWDLQSSDDLFEQIHGKKKVAPGNTPQEGEELYMAMFPNELKRETQVSNLLIKKVSNVDDFSVWANLQNEVLCGGYQDVHPEKHYKWCERGLIDCYIGYKDHVAVAFSSVFKNVAICSLEFVGTHPDFRRRGFAEAVCYTALENAWKHGAKIVTVRAINPGTKELYTKQGFKTYNFAL